MSQPLSLKIGPSGVRGLVGESLTPQLVTSFAAAFGTYSGAGPILVGTDTRPSGEMLEQAAIAGLLSVGCTPVDVGVVPVPALMLHVREVGAFGGISVGGSGGWLEWNAIRFIGSGGLTLRPNQAAELTDLYHQGAYPRVRAQEMSEVRSDSTTIDRHLAAVVKSVDAERIRARRLKVAVDPKHGAASDATLRLLEELGCGTVAIHADLRSPFPPNTGLEDSNLVELCGLVSTTGADVGFAQDVDADRLVIVDETGAPLGADLTVVLVARQLLARRRGPVVVDVSTSRMVDDVASAFGCPVYRTAVGEANVLEAMIEHDAEVGGESDGGVVVLGVNPCRDSFAAMAVVLEALALSDETISGLRARVPRYSAVRERLLCPARDIAPSLRLIRTLFRGERIDLTDGVKVMWDDRWLLARPSATESAIRLAAEAPTQAEARALVNRVLELLSPGA